MSACIIICAQMNAFLEQLAPLDLIASTYKAFSDINDYSRFSSAKYLFKDNDAFPDS